ncbi:hypothetical protein Bca4012_009865 [Brassica carinata]|uniref:Uncharacterized protein n=1 Tax=Brassica carinata TaxID=52824 RepID=A0A8X7V1E3_BRACI|nr:hypothetical protein Bca52824_035091 [Brassica carinata]
MSGICDLSEDLLVKILSLVKTKDAVATSLLSKRWLSLWKLVPRFEYVTKTFATNSDLIDSFLRLSKAPVLDTLHLTIGACCEPEDHERWVNTAFARHVRHLELLHHHLRPSPMPLPKSLFTYKGLVVLSLQQVEVYDIPSTIFLQSLKKLSLLCVRFYSGNKLVRSLLSACPILETLVVRRWLKDDVIIYTIAVPSLQSLYIMERPDNHQQIDDREYVINAPLLKTLRVCDKFSRFRSLVKMPKLVKAEIKIRQEDSNELMGCLTSAKHLSLCLSSSIPLLMEKPCENLCQLQSLEICTKCSSDWLCHLLIHCPKLRVLKLNHLNCGIFRSFEPQWEEPTCVPECFVSCLETLEWIGYKGKKAETEAAIYILDKATHLKNMTLYQEIIHLREKYRTLIDLSSRMRSSIKSQFEFVRLK